MMTVTSELLAELDLECFDTITEHCRFNYRLTDGELGWLEWIGERYSVAVVLWNSLTTHEDTDGSEYSTVTIDTCDISKALSDDGVDRAPCLSDDTQLQRLIWYIGPERD